MKRFSSFLLILAATTFMVAFNACQKNEMMPEETELKKADKYRTFYGPAVPVGNGVARAWIMEDASGEPVEAGIDLTEKALDKLPAHEAEYVVHFPRTKGGNFYDHVLLGWLPGGHGPEMYLYDHFDVHFYMTSVEERMMIEGGVPGPADMALFQSQYLPPTYVPTGEVVPHMGHHWVDVTSPEISGGQMFTHTYIIGSYDGQITYFEPMITSEFLLTKPSVTVPLVQPQAFQRDGWYPLNYKIEWTDRPGKYTIALTGLTWHTGE
jgi:hypothetical protein